jgi:hypothetical protein
VYHKLRYIQPPPFNHLSLSLSLRPIMTPPLSLPRKFPFPNRGRNPSTNNQIAKPTPIPLFDSCPNNASRLTQHIPHAPTPTHNTQHRIHFNLNISLSYINDLTFLLRNPPAKKKRTKWWRILMMACKPTLLCLQHGVNFLSARKGRRSAMSIILVVVVSILAFQNARQRRGHV